MSARRTVLKAGPIVVSVGLAAQGVHAQAAEDEVVLDKIVVQGEQDSELGEVDGYAAEAAVTTTRGIPADIATTPRSISVITSQQIADQGASTLEQAISYAAGVTTQTFGADGRYDQFAIRGFEVQNSNIYRDGMPLRLFGFSGWRTETFGVERVEVLRGPTSSLYGASQPGGLVNVVTKRPRFENSTEFQARTTSDGGLQVGIDQMGIVTEDIAYRFVFLGGELGTQYDETDEERIYIAPSITWQPTDGTKLNVFAQYQKDEVPDSYILVPQYGSDLPNPIASYGNDFYANNPDRNDIETTQSYIGYEFEHEFGEGFTFRSRARYADNDWTNETGYSSVGFASAGNPPNAVDSSVIVDFDVDSRAKQATFDNAVSKDFVFGNVNATIIGGLDYYQSDTDVTQVFGLGGLRNLLTGVISGPALSPIVTSTTDQKVKQTGLYAIGNFEIGQRWIVDASLRHDWINIRGSADSVSPFALPGLNDTTNLDDNDNFTSATLGGSYLVGNGLSLYGSLGRSFNLPPAGADINGNALGIEKSQAWEVGAKFRPLGSNSLLSIAYYDITKKDTPSVDPGNPLRFEQLGEVRSKGVEVSANYAFENGVSVLGTYSYIDAKITKNPDNQGNRLARIPEHSASLWVAYDVAQVEGLRIGAGARYTGDRFSDNANDEQFKLDDVTVFDASATYQWNGWTATLAARNLADKEYTTYCQLDTQAAGIAAFVIPGFNPDFAGGCAYGAGRTIDFTVSRRF